MSTKNIKVGDTVRINSKYAKHANFSLNKVGTEFVVTAVHEEPKDSFLNQIGMDASFYVQGDPDRCGVWAECIELVTPSITVTRKQLIDLVTMVSPIKNGPLAPIYAEAAVDLFIASIKKGN